MNTYSIMKYFRKKRRLHAARLKIQYPFIVSPKYYFVVTVLRKFLLSENNFKNGRIQNVVA